MHGQAAGFWSYVQQDNADDSGRILDLAERLRAAYRLRQAEDLTLFVDRESLQWGDEWSARIDAAIAGTTFFIPLITPSYFQSRACRKELLKFAREATSLGLEQLILPIYWVTVPELSQDPSEATDEAVKVVARYQWQDFREVRLEDESSAAFRKAVSKLAEELAERATRVTATVEDVPAPVQERKEVIRVADASSGQLVQGEPVPADEDDDSPGILEKLAASEDAWPQITEITETIGREIQRVGEITRAGTARMEAADARGAGIKGRLVQTEKMAHALADPARTLERLGHEYAVVLADLDPGVQTLLDLAASSEPDEDGRADLLTVIQELAVSSDEALTSLSEMLDATAETAKFSRSLRAPLNQIRKGLQGVLDGRAVIEDWGRRAQAIEEADVWDRTDETR